MFESTKEEQKQPIHQLPEKQKAEEETADNQSGLIIRNYQEKENDNLFYHFYTSREDLIEPIHIKVEHKSMQKFKDYLRDNKKDENAKFTVATKELVLLPVMDTSLRINEYTFPKSIHPIFSTDSSEYLYTYPCKITPIKEEQKDLDNLTYYLECRFILTTLDILAMSSGETQKIMEIVMKELFASYLFD